MDVESCLEKCICDSAECRQNDDGSWNCEYERRRLPGKMRRLNIHICRRPATGAAYILIFC